MDIEPNGFLKHIWELASAGTNKSFSEVTARVILNQIANECMTEIERLDKISTDDNIEAFLQTQYKTGWTEVSAEMGRRSMKETIKDYLAFVSSSS